jgi:hypothetical protein
MGEIVFWTLVRLAIVIPGLIILSSYIDIRYWWFISILAIYLLVIYPTVSQYRKFEERSKDVVEGTLCSSCKHFSPSSVFCNKYDKHPTVDYIPCEGQSWEPK